MNLIKNSSNRKNPLVENSNPNKTTLKLLQILNQSDIKNTEKSQNFLILKLINTLSFKKILTSKSTNRLVQQYITNFIIKEKKNLDKRTNLNPGIHDENYCNTLFLNSIYELINSKE